MYTTDLAAVEGTLEESDYGIDWYGPSRMNSIEDVVLEGLNCPLTDQ